MTERASLIAAPDERAEKWGDTTFSVQWRCSDMGGHEGPSAVPKPCPACFSIAVTSTVIPYRESKHWTMVTA